MNRFDNLNRNHGTKLMSFRFNGREYEVRCTDHSLERFIERGLNIDEALGAIITLGKERLDYLSEKGDDVAIIDKYQGQTVIITFESERDYTQIRIVTIIKKTNIYVKEGTKILCLSNCKEEF